MKKLNHRLTKFIQNHWFGFYVVVMLAIPGIVNFLMNLAIPTLPELTAPTWLGFWGSYLGGAIGCLPALAAYDPSLFESYYFARVSSGIFIFRYAGMELSSIPRFSTRNRVSLSLSNPTTRKSGIIP